MIKYNISWKKTSMFDLKFGYFVRFFIDNKP